MAIIESVTARWILDSRGNPTVEAIVKSKGIMARASVPSGASTGKREAKELRDNKKQFHGKGVEKAVSNIKKIISKYIVGMNVFRQKDIDALLLSLDGTENKEKLGANAILAVSLAVAKLAAKIEGIPLWQYLRETYYIKKYPKPKIPVILSNVINGGKHAGNALKFQEFMLVPLKFSKVEEAIQATSEVYWQLKKNLAREYGKNAINVGDEGGFAPPLEHPSEALDLLEEAIEDMHYKKKFKIALDVAASEIYSDGKYDYNGKKPVSWEKLLEYYERIVKAHPLFSIEDPFDQEDYDAWKAITKKLGRKIQIVGDDLTVTNPKIIELALQERLCNAFLIKPNQIGTLSETMDAIILAQRAGKRTIVSHRSGETNETYIIDIALATNSQEVKIGAPARGERIAKFNALIRYAQEHNLKYGPI